MVVEAERLKVLQSEVEKQTNMGDQGKKSRNFWVHFILFLTVAGSSTQFPTLEEKVDADNRSIYVGQVRRIFLHFRLIGTIQNFDFRLIGKIEIFDFRLIGKLEIFDFRLIGKLEIFDFRLTRKIGQK